MTRPASWRRSRPAETSRTPIAKRFRVRRPRRLRQARSCGDLGRSAFAKSFEADALDPVAESLVGPPVGAKRHENRTEQVGYACDRNVRCVHAVEACAVEVARKHHVVLAQRRADKPHITEVPPRAPVGASPPPETDSLPP